MEVILKGTPEEIKKVISGQTEITKCEASKNLSTEGANLDTLHVKAKLYTETSSRTRDILKVIEDIKKEHKKCALHLSFEIT